MRCRTCGHNEDKVLDTRIQKDGGIRRRRECLSCKSRYSTIETIILSYPFVIKKDGRREPFNKEKLLRGLQAACQKRPVSSAQLDSIVDRLSNWLLNRGDDEILSRLIGRRVMAELKQVDDVAYVRFASVYKNFKDVQEFVEKLEGDELIDAVESTGPQMSLTAQNFIPTQSPTTSLTEDQKNETPLARAGTTAPLSN